MISLFKRLKQRYWYGRLLREHDVYTLSDDDMDNLSEGAPISAELAMRLMAGDPDAIKELESGKPDKRLPKEVRYTKSNGETIGTKD